jgi:Predicted membrane protein (DUF2142)
VLRPSTGRTPLLVSAFLGLMGVAWLMSTPPGSAFDEPAHYTKAIGVGRGEFRGQAPTARAEDLRKLFEVGEANPDALATLGNAVTSRAGRWQMRTQRRFDVPPNLFSAKLGCTYGRREVGAACVDEPEPAPPPSGPVGSYVGTYQPYVYVPAGLAIRLVDEPYLAVRMGRAATLLVGLVLLVGAVFVLWSPAAGSLSLVGLAVALTPMVLFVASVLSPSGPEVAAAVCLSAVLLRLGRDESPPGWIWLALGASGAVLASARSLGPPFLVLILAVVAVLVGPRRLGGRMLAGGRAALAAWLVVGLAALAGVWWQLTRQPSPSPSGTSVGDALGPSWDHLGEIARQIVGVFGALDALMPRSGMWLWYGLLALLGGTALVVGRRGERLSVVALLPGAVAVTMVMSVVYREIGPLHGRYVLPLVGLIPLWYGEVVLRRRELLSAAVARVLPILIFGVAAGVQLFAWWSNSRRFAVGEEGSWAFVSDAQWSPPGGWWPWAVLAALAAALYVAAPLVDRSAPSRGRPQLSR